MNLIIAKDMVKAFRYFPFSHQNHLDEIIGLEYNEALKKIRRFNSKKIMLYRTSLYDHIEIGKLMLQELAKEGKISAYIYHEALFQHHDDEELLISDIPYPFKVALLEKDKKELEKWQIQAIETLIKHGPKYIGNYLYEDLLYESHYKNKIQTKINSIIDKKQAYRQAIIEVKRGNHLFFEPVWNFPTIINDLIEKYNINENKHEFLKKEVEFDNYEKRMEHLKELITNNDYFNEEIMLYIELISKYNFNILTTENESLPKQVIPLNLIKANIN